MRKAKLMRYVSHLSTGRLWRREVRRRRSRLVQEKAGAVCVFDYGIDCHRVVWKCEQSKGEISVSAPR